MKKTIGILFIALMSCGEQKKVVDPAFQKKQDSINRLIQCNECQQDKVRNGASSEWAEIYCKKLYGLKTTK
jgi:hypothetical protein